MNISNIKKRADEILTECRPQLTRIFIIMMLVRLIPTIFTSAIGSVSSVITMIVTFIFMTFDHGHIVTTLKAVRHNSQAISDDDAFVGFKRYGELFFTYFLPALIIGAITFVVCFIMLLFFIPFIGAIMTYFPGTLISGVADGNIYAQLATYFQYAPQLVIGIFVMVFIVLAIVYFISIYVFAMPYLLEQYHMTGTAALKESISMMSGHGWQFFKLMFSFFGWIILTAIVQAVLSSLLGFIPVLGSIIAVAASSLFGIYTYLLKYTVSRTIFFEELAYYRYEVNNNQNRQGVSYEKNI